jgi:glycosyltransferase involved in cell wall biosynthesis
VKVLWFVNVPFPPVDRALPAGTAFSGSGWWMAGLLAGLRATGDVDVHVAWGHDGDYHSTVRLDHVTTVEAFPFWQHSKPSRPGRIGGSRAEALSLLASRYPAGVDDVIERVEPQLIHVHGTEGPAGLLLERWKIPTVVSIQGSPAACATRYWGSNGLLTRLRHPRGAFNRTMLAARGRREARILRNARAVAGRTRWDERFCRSRAPQAVYYRAFECIRPEFLSQLHGRQPDRTEKRVVVVGSAQPYKGMEIAISAVTRLRASGQKVRLIICGSFPSVGWGQEILKRVATAGPDAVELAGYLPASEIAEQLAAADAFVLPSHVENSSNSLLEAMAVGTPCVAARVGGIPSMLRDGREGLLFPRGDVEGLERQLARLLRDRDLASRLGRAAADRARATCQPADVAKATIRMYERLGGADVASQPMAAFA